MAGGLKVHPSLVLIGAIIGVQLFGFIGVVIAAPIMATFKLFFRYVIKKLADENPWEDIEKRESDEVSGWLPNIKPIWGAIKEWFIKIWQQLKKKQANLSERDSKAPPNPHETGDQDKNS